MKNCPCCKSLRAMTEAAQHPSETSLANATRANLAFSEGREKATAELIVQCPVHGTPEALDKFWEEYDQLVRQVKLGALRSAASVFRRRGVWVGEWR